jgi:hypothetical protein
MAAHGARAADGEGSADRLPIARSPPASQAFWQGIVEYRWAEGEPARLPDLAAEHGQGAHTPPCYRCALQCYSAAYTRRSPIVLAKEALTFCSLVELD